MNNCRTAKQHDFNWIDSEVFGFMNTRLFIGNLNHLWSSFWFHVSRWCVYHLFNSCVFIGLPFAELCCLYLLWCLLYLFWDAHVYSRVLLYAARCSNYESRTQNCYYDITCTAYSPSSDIFQSSFWSSKLRLAGLISLKRGKRKLRD